jgi:hypothetical protein
MILLLKNTPRANQFAPRVDGKSLVLKNPLVVGEAQEAKINDASLTNGEVVVWDGTNSVLKSTGVSDTELQVLNNALIGSAVASKAVVLSENKDHSGIRNLSITGNNTVEGILTVVGSGEFSSSIKVIGLTELMGDISTQGSFRNTSIKLVDSFISSKIRTSTRLVFARNQDTLEFGNSVDAITLITGSVLKRKTGGAEYKIWDELSDGTGSGLDADLLDGVHSTSFLRSDTDAEMGGNLVMKGKYISYKTAVGDEKFRLRLTGTDFNVYDVVNAKTSFSVYNDKAYVNGSQVLTAANYGALNADTLDTLHASQLLRSDVDSTLSGKVTSVLPKNGLYFYDGTGFAKVVFQKYGSDFTGIGVDSVGNMRLGACDYDGTWRSYNPAYNLYYGQHKVMHMGNMGESSGFSCDMVDGYHASSLLSFANHTRGIVRAENESTGKPKIINLAKNGRCTSYTLNVNIANTNNTGGNAYLNFLEGMEDVISGHSNCLSAIGTVKIGYAGNGSSSAAFNINIRWDNNGTDTRWSWVEGLPAGKSVGFYISPQGYVMIQTTGGIIDLAMAFTYSSVEQSW